MEEIRQQLAKLGYGAQSARELHELKRDLDQFVARERSADDSHSELDWGSLAAGSARAPPLTTDDDAASESMASSVASSRLKRKTVRHADAGAVRRVEETYTENSSLRDDAASVTSTLEDDFSLTEVTPRLPRVAFQERLLKSGSSRRSSSCLSQEPQRRERSAVIWPGGASPHTRDLRRVDRVARYHQYARAWAARRGPGEEARAPLRWAVREAMAQEDPLPARKSMLRPVEDAAAGELPTEKRRQALRWQVRRQLAEFGRPALAPAAALPLPRYF